MKIFFSNIYKLSDEYHEILVDENNFKHAQYLTVSPVKQAVKGIVYDELFVLEPLSYFKIKLKHIPNDFKQFYLNSRLLEAGIIYSGIDRENKNIFVFNTTNNHVYIKPGTVIGEIE